ncbi:hypothetical protein CAEBREN_22781 [Caenorhabditis brenneri]|uniref:Mitochondrial import inner membrane translocase subunit Tim29 n=1 Tax=Caenorhabditis brenneri TaxID=135651 RepID=G0MP35_CAEBE|nr:hypothetical protein CAEBREN_22781 [Caenorhabditis brenneri]
MAAASVRGFFQRTGISIKEYFQRMGRDYATVAKETAAGCKERPIKAAVVFSGLGFLTYAYRTNPTELEMLDYLCERRQQLVLVPTSEHNPTTTKELVSRDFFLSQNRLHHYNLWFFSLLVASDHNDKLRIYSSQDSNLKEWPWTELWNNIVDVGALGKWWKMDTAFVDYDINTDEINLLPDGEK